MNATENVTEIATPRPDPPPLDNQELVERIAELAWDKKAFDVRALRVRELVQYTDWFVVMSGRSDRQVAAIRDHIADTLLDERGLKPLSSEGSDQNQWVLVDYGDVVVHIFYEPVREYYQLEGLWSEAPQLELDAPDDEPTVFEGARA